MTPFYTLLRFIFQAYGALARRGAAGKFTREHSFFSLFLILLKAYGAAAKSFFRMWRKRTDLRRLKRVRDGEFSEWLRRFGISARAIALMD